MVTEEMGGLLDKRTLAANSWDVPESARDGSGGRTTRWAHWDAGREGASESATIYHTVGLVRHHIKHQPDPGPNASPAIHPLIQTGASNSPGCRRPSANVTERPSAIRNTGRVFMHPWKGKRSR